MESELTGLEHKLEALLDLFAALRAENQQLRAQLAGAEGERQRLAQKIETARSRLETVMHRLPP